MSAARPRKTPHKPECPIKRAERLRLYRRKRPDVNKSKNAAYRAANPEKNRAHKIVERAVIAGRLIKTSCERCGASYLVHAHHDDYSKPLEVTWLCPTHHRERHRELKAAAND